MGCCGGKKGSRKTRNDETYRRYRDNMNRVVSEYKKRKNEKK